MQDKQHIRLYVGDRRVFTAIHRGRRHIYYPCTQYYLRRFCDIVGTCFEVRTFETIELVGRTGRYVFRVEDIYIKDIEGKPHFKVYLGDVVEYEYINEHHKG